MTAFYDFFRKFKFTDSANSNKAPHLNPLEEATFEADSVIDTATFVAGQNISFTVNDIQDENGGPVGHDGVPFGENERFTIDTVTINGPDYQTYVPLGTTKIRLERDLGQDFSDIEITNDPQSTIRVYRTADNQIVIGHTGPNLPYSQENIEDFSAALLTGGVHVDLTATYQDRGEWPVFSLQSSTNGNGSNANFRVSVVNNQYVVNVEEPGAGYAVGDTIIILGSGFPLGLTPDNDLTMIVAEIGTTTDPDDNEFVTFMRVTPSGTVPYRPGVDLAVTSTLQTVTNRGSATSNTITILNATESTSTSTGALKVVGGIGAQGTLRAGSIQATPIGSVNESTGKFTTVQSTTATGTAPFIVASTSEVANLHSETASRWHTPRTVTFTGDVSGTFTLDGSADISDVALTVGLDKVALGDDTTGNYAASLAVSGNGLSITGSAGESVNYTVTSNATSTNTGSTIVFRNASGNFSANTITAELNGNASTVTNGIYTTDTGTVTNVMLAGSIANSKLLNNSITINSTTVALGGSITGLATTADPSFTGTTTVGGILKINAGVNEKFQTKSSATGVVEHDCSSGQVFYHTTPSANWTVNLTNLNLSAEYATTVVVVVSQGAVGYYPNAVQIGGVNQTLRWVGNTVPTPSTNRVDVISFSIINNSGTYIVLAQLTGF